MADARVQGEIATYLQTLNPSFTPANTVLFSNIQGFPGIQQMLIPPQLLGSSGGLNINVQCYQKSDQAGQALLSQYGPAAYSNFNIQGSPT